MLWHLTKSVWYLVGIFFATCILPRSSKEPEPSLVAYTYHLSTWEVQVRRLSVQNHSWLHSKFKASLSYMKLSHNPSREGGRGEREIIGAKSHIMTKSIFTNRISPLLRMFCFPIEKSYLDVFRIMELCPGSCIRTTSKVMFHGWSLRHSSFLFGKSFKPFILLKTSNIFSVRWINLKFFSSRLEM